MAHALRFLLRARAGRRPELQPRRVHPLPPGAPAPREPDRDVLRRREPPRVSADARRAPQHGASRAADRHAVRAPSALRRGDGEAHELGPRRLRRAAHGFVGLRSGARAGRDREVGAVPGRRRREDAHLRPVRLRAPRLRAPRARGSPRPVVPSRAVPHRRAHAHRRDRNRASLRRPEGRPRPLPSTAAHRDHRRQDAHSLSPRRREARPPSGALSGRRLGALEGRGAVVRPRGGDEPVRGLPGHTRPLAVPVSPRRRALPREDVHPRAGVQGLRGARRHRRAVSHLLSVARRRSHGHGPVLPAERRAVPRGARARRRRDRSGLRALPRSRARVREGAGRAASGCGEAGPRPHGRVGRRGNEPRLRAHGVPALRQRLRSARRGRRRPEDGVGARLFHLRANLLQSGRRLRRLRERGSPDSRRAAT